MGAALKAGNVFLDGLQLVAEMRGGGGKWPVARERGGDNQSQQLALPGEDSSRRGGGRDTGSSSTFAGRHHRDTRDRLDDVSSRDLFAGNRGGGRGSPPPRRRSPPPKSRSPKRSPKRRKAPSRSRSASRKRSAGGRGKTTFLGLLRPQESKEFGNIEGSISK